MAMKSLCLLRHAKSGDHDLGLRDFDRTINDRGRRAARLIGQWMARKELSFDHVLTSPAVRTHQTLEEVQGGFGLHLGAIDEKRIYLASAAALLELVREIDDAYESSLLVGHNPGLMDLVLDLLPDDGSSPLRESVYTKFPTCSFARLESSSDRWADFTAGNVRLTDFVRPRDLDPDLGPEN